MGTAEMLSYFELVVTFVSCMLNMENSGMDYDFKSLWWRYLFFTRSMVLNRLSQFGVLSSVTYLYPKK